MWSQVGGGVRGRAFLRFNMGKCIVRRHVRTRAIACRRAACIETAVGVRAAVAGGDKRASVVRRTEGGGSARRAASRALAAIDIPAPVCNAVSRCGGEQIGVKREWTTVEAGRGRARTPAGCGENAAIQA